MIDRAEHEICRRRGHDAMLLSAEEKWSRCKLCGVWLRSVTVIEEREDEPPEKERSPFEKFER